MAGRKTAIVTGAGSGIGRACAIALLQADYAVLLAGRRESALQETQALAVEACSQSSDSIEAIVVPTDVTDAESVAELFARPELLGRLDVVFNNAGIGAPSVPLEDLSVEQWQSVVDVNLTGVFLCIQAAFKVMKSQDPMGGRIINNGSISADRPRPNSAPYTATKHAITGLTKSAALDGRKYNIACGQIDIGNASTEMTARMSGGVPQADGSLAVEPTMDVQNVANAVVHMASLPLDANIQFMTVMATKMPFIGRG